MLMDTACQALRQGKVLELRYDGYSRAVAKLSQFRARRGYWERARERMFSGDR